MNQTEESPYSSSMSDAQPGPIGGSTSGLAVSSFVLGMLSLLLTCFTGIVGAVLGIVALVKINSSGGQLKGRGFAIAGLVLSAIMSAVGFFALLIALLLPALQAARDAAREQQKRQIEAKDEAYEQRRKQIEQSAPPKTSDEKN